jgi:hypothetical protein
VDVNALVAFLAPFLPYLIMAGGKVAEEAGQRIGGAAREQRLAE